MKRSLKYAPVILIGLIMYGCQPSALRESVAPHPALESGLMYSALYAAERLGSEDRQSEMMRRIAVFHAEEAKYPEATSIAQRIPIRRKEDETLAEIAILIAQGGDRRKAGSVAEKIKSDYQKSRVLSCIAVAYESAGEYGKGREIAGTIPEPNYRARAFAGIAAVYYKAGYRDLALRLFNQALDAARREQSLSHHIGTILYISRKYAEAGEKRRAEAIVNEAIELSELLGGSHLPSVWGMILETDGRPEVIQKAVQTARSLSDESGYYNDKLLSRSALAYARAGSYEFTAELSGEIGDIPLRAITIASAAGIAASRGDTERADRLFAAAVSESESIDNPVFKNRAFRETGSHAASALHFDTVDYILESLNNGEGTAYTALEGAFGALKARRSDLVQRYLNITIQSLNRVDDPASGAEILSELAVLHSRGEIEPDDATKSSVSRLLHALD